jgi:hypothetical protein
LAGAEGSSKRGGLRWVHVLVPSLLMLAIAAGLYVVSFAPSATVRAYRGELARLEDAAAGRGSERLIDGRPFAVSDARVLGPASGTPALAYDWRHVGTRNERRSGPQKSVLDEKVRMVPFDLVHDGQLFRIGARLGSVGGCVFREVAPTFEESLVQPGDPIAVLGVPGDLGGKPGLYGTVDLRCGTAQAWLDDARARLAKVDQPSPPLRFGAYFSAAIAVLMLLGGAVLRSLTKPADVRGPRKKQRA